MLKCKIMRFTAEEEEAIGRQLSDILASQAFKGSASGQRLLRYLVTETIAGRHVKEETIRPVLYPESPADSAVVRTARPTFENGWTISTRTKTQIVGYGSRFPKILMSPISIFNCILHPH